MAFSKLYQVAVRGARLDELLRRRAPDHHHAINFLLIAESVDVFANRVQHRPLVDGAEGVVGADVLYVLTVECGRHRPNRAQRVRNCFNVTGSLEHAGPLRSDIRVIRKRVPCAPFDVFQLGERHEVFDER